MNQPFPAATALTNGPAAGLPPSGSWEAVAAALGGAPDPGLIAQLANALFSTAPGQSVPSAGVATPSAPLVGAAPTAGAVPPGTPAVPSVGHVTTNPALPQIGPLAAAPTPPPVGLTSLPPVNPPGESDLRSLPSLLGNIVQLVPPSHGEGATVPSSPTPPAIPAALPSALSNPFAGGAAPVSGIPASPPASPSAPIPFESGLPRVPASFEAMKVPKSFDTPKAPASSVALPYAGLNESRAVAEQPPPPPDFSPVALELRPELVPDLGSGVRPFDANAYRQDFPILQTQVHGKPLIWLDNAATTQKPRAVIDRLSHFYEHENSNIHRAAHALAARSTDAYEAAREKVRRFLGAGSVNEIVFVRGATEGINLVAQSWGRRNVGKDDEIVITWLEHHANIVPWQQLCAEKGARLRVAPVDDSGQVILEEYEKLLNPRTRLVSLTQVSNALGTVTPVAEMVAMARRRGATVLVDGAQSVSHMRVNVQALDCDFFVLSGHKMFGPTGIGVVYGKEAVLNAMPPWQGGGNMIADVTFEKTLYHAAPSRFEAGTGNIADAAGLGAAIDYLDRVGMENICRWEHELLGYATEGLQTVPGLTLIGTAKEKAGVLSFVLDGCRTEDVGAALDREGIAVRSGHHCAQPILRRFGLESTVRPSLAFYNTFGDIDALIAALLRLQAGRNFR